MKTVLGFWTVIFMVLHFSFNIKTFGRNGEMDEEAWSYIVGRTAVCDTLGVKHDMQRTIEYALWMNLHAKNLAYEFSRKAWKPYEESGFTLDQKVIFLT